MIKRRTVGVVLGALMTLVLPSVVGSLTTASAETYHEWTLSGVTFDDGGTLTGTLVLSSDGTPHDVDVTTAGGDTATFGTYNYNSDKDPISQPPWGGWILHQSDRTVYIDLMLPDVSTAKEGDSVPLPNGGYECTNCGDVRYINSGSIVEGGVVDTTPPDVSATVDPASPDGANGWYTSSPTVTFTASDPDTAITDQSGCDQQTVDTDTTGVTFTCMATSGGGTNSASVTIMRDATPPTLAPKLTPAGRVLLHGPISVAVNAADATSGLDTAGCGDVSTATGGLHRVTCSVTDNAGNQVQATVRYTVRYLMTPLTVVGKWRAHHVVTVGMRLTDAAGHPIGNQAAAALGCQVKFSLTGAQRQRGCFSYHPNAHQFTYQGTLGKRTGAAAVHAVVSYPGSAVKTTRAKAVTIKA